MLYHYFDKKAKNEKDSMKMMAYNYYADLMYDLIDSYK